MRPYSRLVLLALGGLISLAVAVGVGRFIYTPILPFMVEDLGLTKGDAGLIASANYVGYLIGALIGTTPLLGGSRRAWLLTSLAVSAVTTMAMGLTSSMVLFLTLRLIGGIASALILVFASTLVLERLRASGDGRLASLHFAGVGTGLALAAAMVSLLVQGGVGWRGHWIVGGALSLIAAAAVAAFVQKEAEPPALPRQQTGANRYLTLLITAYGLFGIGYVITATFIMAIVRDNAEIRPLEPYIWILVGVSAAPSVAVWTWIAGRIGIIPAFSAACLVQAVGVAASVLWISAPGIVLAAFCLGATIMGITALGLVAAQAISGGDPRHAFSLMTASFGTGQIVGPIFAGYVHDVTGSFLLPSLVAAGTLIVAAALSALAAPALRNPGSGAAS